MLPLLWMLSNSFQPNEVAMSTPPQFIPKNPTLENYLQLFQGTNAWRWLFNSISISAIATVLMVYLSSLAAYPLAKKRFPGHQALFYVILAFMTVPREAILLPLFLQINDWGLYDTYLGILLPNVAWPFAVFLMKQFFGTIPTEIIEAARMDGCSELRLFHQILLPIVKPAIGSLAVFAFVHAWNDYTWQLIVTKSDTLRTLPLGIATLSDEFVYNYGLTMAGAVVGAIPLLIIFVAFQRFFISGITLGAVKG